MSAQHTPGRLCVAVDIFDNDGMPETALQALGGAATVAVALEFGPNNPGMREANARRLVACWNACDGISTESLESEGNAALGWARTASKLIHATTQRDELLAALIEARRWIGDGECSDGLSRECWTPEYIKAVDGIDAAIAKATGEKA